MAYNLRERKEKQLQRRRPGTVQRKSTVCKGKGSKDELYELEVVETDRANHRVKVHYDSDDDEWRSESDVKILYPVQGKLHVCSKIYRAGLVRSSTVRLLST